MRCIFFIQQLFLWLQRIHHTALALTTYDKFLNLSDGMHAFFHTTNNNFKPGIVSYPNYWKTLPRMSQWIHNVAKITRFFATFLAALLVKRCTLLTSSSTKQRGVSPLWLSQGEISLLNEQASKKLTRLVTATKILKQSIVKCHPLRNNPSLGWYARLPCYAELSREKKAPNIKANAFRLFFFQTANVLFKWYVQLHTQSSLRSQFQFLCESGSTLIWGLSSFFPSPCSVQLRVVFALS